MSAAEMHTCSCLVSNVWNGFIVFKGAIFNTIEACYISPEVITEEPILV